VTASSVPAAPPKPPAESGAEAGAPAAAPPSAGASLLREGSYLIQVKGRLKRGDDDGWWRFQVAGDGAGQGYELAVLPCMLLSRMERLVESSPERSFVFDLTGQVLVYRGRNYLLPTHAPRLTIAVATLEPAAATRDGEAEPAAPAGAADSAAREPDAAGPDDSLEESPEGILRRLDESVGPVVRSPRTGESAATPDGPPEGSFVMWRRGWIVRDHGGAWTFVFESDARGLADPPLVLLPCLLLEQMEEYAERSGPVAPVLVSGRVYRSERRAYLLPSAFMVPRDRLR
jgi:hypothetical protein